MNAGAGIGTGTVFTVTLNPSIDVTLWVDELSREAVARIRRETREPGGKGVNVSRVLTRFGVDNTCFVLAGRDDAAAYEKMLRDDRITPVILETDGAVRENLTLCVRRSGADGSGTNGEAYNIYKINRLGRADDGSLESLTARLLEHVKADDIVVVSGSVPTGISAEMFRWFLAQIRETGARLALDSDAVTLEDIRKIKPWLVKPNREELARLAPSMPPMDGDREAVFAAARAARTVRDAGTDIVLVTLGAQGALCVTSEEEIFAKAPAVAAGCAVGAGDSALAGFLAARQDGRGLADCVRAAVACGSDCAGREGTGLAQVDGARELEREVEIEIVRR